MFDLLVRFQQLADEVASIGGAALREQPHPIRTHPINDLPPLLVGGVFEELQGVVANIRRLLFVQAVQAGDDAERKRDRQLLDEVGPTAGDEGVDQAVDHRLDLRLHRLGGRSTGQRTDERTELAVLGRVVVDRREAVVRHRRHVHPARRGVGVWIHRGGTHVRIPGEGPVAAVLVAARHGALGAQLGIQRVGTLR